MRARQPLAYEVRLKALEGRIAVVTGAARGIGQAIALELANRGAKIVAVDLREADETTRLIEANGGRCRAITADVSDPAISETLADEACKGWDPCQILVNNAALQLPPTPVAQVSYEVWRRVIQTNLDSMFLTCKAFLPAMVAHQHGRIINVASTSIFTSSPGLVPYMASKGGVIGLTSALANDLGGYGVTVNAVSPGFTRTPPVDEAIEAGGFPEAMADAVVAMQTIKRPATPHDVAGLVCFLASDDASFITGQFLSADGGLTRH